MSTPYYPISPCTRTDSPKDRFIERFSVSFVQCGDVELEKEINDLVDEFCSHLRDHQESMGQMRVLFFERRQQSTFWKLLGSEDDKVCWEEWILPIRLLGATPARTQWHRDELSLQIQDRLQFIIKTVTDKKEHIPPVPKELTGTATFYHEIKVLGEKASSATLQAFKGMSSAKLI